MAASAAASSVITMTCRALCCILLTLPSTATTPAVFTVLNHESLVMQPMRVSFSLSSSSGQPLPPDSKVSRPNFST